MKTRYSVFVLFYCLSLPLFSQEAFNDFFLPKTMRFDYNIAGSAYEQHVYFEQIREEPYWGGPKKNLIDPFDFGDYRYLVVDSASDELIFSRGFSDLFFEWQDTDEAKKINRSFYGSIVFPYPKNPVRLQIDRRKPNMEWEKLYEFDIDPKSYFVNKDQTPAYKTKKIYGSGNPSEKVDIVIIPDAYTKKQMRKFHRDSKRFIHYFFACPTFARYPDRFNFWVVDAPSQDNGPDIPGKEVWNRTVLNTHFYTFDSERYLTTRDVRSIRDVAGCVPYDQVYILVNSEKYGGGGIYNFYNLCSSDHPASDKVFTHEFGHAFAALADEYAYEDTPPEELYDLTVEPFQVNITTLADFDKKWKNLVDPGVPIPTPFKSNYNAKIGAFEGAGYVKTKMYRPMADCKMRSNSRDEFCPVCEKAIIAMIEFYCDEE